MTFVTELYFFGSKLEVFHAKPSVFNSNLISCATKTTFLLLLCVKPSSRMGNFYHSIVPRDPI